MSRCNINCSIHYILLPSPPCFQQVKTSKTHTHVPTTPSRYKRHTSHSENQRSWKEQFSPSYDKVPPNCPVYCYLLSKLKQDFLMAGMGRNITTTEKAGSIKEKQFVLPFLFTLAHSRKDYSFFSSKLKKKVEIQMKKFNFK